jgi:metallo-beta-lactamase class B
MSRMSMAMVVGLIATSAVGGQAQDQSARGRDDLRWALPSGYIPRGEWQVQIPFRIFDNIYFVGNEAVSSYLITTSDGLVLIDATNALMVDRTLDNIRQLGFDPKDIKYVFITESHEIHYGGAAQIKAETGATICLSAADWDFVEQAAARADQPEYDWTTQVPPPRDHEIQDGEVITVGDATFTLHRTRR